MSSEHDICVLKVIAYYKFDGEMKDKNGRSMGVHPRVEMLTEFLKKNIPENQLEEFYNKIIRYCKFFPTKIDLLEFMPDHKDYYVEDRKFERSNKMVSFNSLSDDIGLNKVSRKPKPGCTYEQAWQNRNKMPAQKMLDDFGLDIFRRVWMRDGAEATDERYEKEIRNKGFKR